MEWGKQTGRYYDGPAGQEKEQKWTFYVQN